MSIILASRFRWLTFVLAFLVVLLGFLDSVSLTLLVSPSPVQFTEVPLGAEKGLALFRPQDEVLGQEHAQVGGRGPGAHRALPLLAPARQ